MTCWSHTFFDFLTEAAAKKQNLQQLQLNTSIPDI